MQNIYMERVIRILFLCAFMGLLGCLGGDCGQREKVIKSYFGALQAKNTERLRQLMDPDSVREWDNAVDPNALKTLVDTGILAEPLTAEQLNIKSVACVSSDEGRDKASVSPYFFQIRLSDGKVIGFTAQMRKGRNGWLIVIPPPFPKPSPH